MLDLFDGAMRPAGIVVIEGCAQWIHQTAQCLSLGMLYNVHKLLCEHEFDVISATTDSHEHDGTLFDFAVMFAVDRDWESKQPADYDTVSDLLLDSFRRHECTAHIAVTVYQATACDAQSPEEVDWGQPTTNVVRVTDPAAVFPQPTFESDGLSARPRKVKNSLPMLVGELLDLRRQLGCLTSQSSPECSSPVSVGGSLTAARAQEPDTPLFISNCFLPDRGSFGLRRPLLSSRLPGPSGGRGGESPGSSSALTPQGSMDNGAAAGGGVAGTQRSPGGGVAYLDTGQLRRRLSSSLDSCPGNFTGVIPS